MSVEENVQLMRRWIQEVWNEGRTETVYELFAADGVARGQNSADGELHGPQEFEGFVHKIRGSFSDMKIKVEDVFGAGDRVALRWSAVMKHIRGTRSASQPAATLFAVAESRLLGSTAERSSRAGTTGINSACWSRSASTARWSRRDWQRGRAALPVPR